MTEERLCLRHPGLVHLLVTAADEDSAYRVFDALVERFPEVGPPSPRPAPDGLVAFSVLTPTPGPPTPGPPTPGPPTPGPTTRGPTGC